MRISMCSIRNFYRLAVAHDSSRLLHYKPKGLYTAHFLPATQPPFPSARLKATFTVQDSSNKGALSKILKKIGWFTLSRSKLRRTGHYLYESVADQLQYSLFFKEFDMENSFFSWFLITELHVWMLLVRVMAEGEEGRFVRNSLVEAMWEDVSTRAKKLHTLNSSTISTTMSELSEQFQAAIVAYDEGILSEDRVLAGAIWRRFLKQECCNPEQVEYLVKYVRQQVQLLDELPSEKVLFSPSISWIPLQSIQDVHLR